MAIAKKLVFLVVESNRNVRKIIKNILVEGNANARPPVEARVIEAEDGKAAWQMLNEEPIDLVICDAGAPELSGLDLLRKVRWSEEFRHLPFILAASRIDQAFVDQALSLEVSDYVVKPLSADILLQKVDKALAKADGAVPAAQALGAPPPPPPRPGLEPESEPEAALEPELEVAAEPDVGPETRAEPDGPESEAAEPALARPMDIGDVLANRRVSMSFQPILSVGGRSILGFEALARGFHGLGGGGESGEAEIPAIELFGRARTPEEVMALDRLCCDKALRDFASAYRKNPRLKLSLNISPASLGAGLRDVALAARELAIPLQAIILEIPEPKVPDDTILSRFIEAHRRLGFLVAFDNLTDRGLNFDRILAMRPEYLKLDRSLTRSIDQDSYRREAVRAIAAIAAKAGSVVAASGVEREEEAVALLELRVSTLQGFFFDTPLKKDVSGVEKYHYLIEYVAFKYTQHTLQRIKREHQSSQRIQAALAGLGKRLAAAAPESFDGLLPGLFSDCPECLGAYVLAENGTQLTETVTNPATTSQLAKEPPAKGARHSIDDYFIHVRAGYRRFTTEPYVSPYAGTLCRTHSLLFAAGGAKFILCVDVAA